MAVENEAAVNSTTATSTGEQGLFLRKSSGLVREVGLRDTFGINIGILSLIGGVTVFAIFQVAFQNADYYFPLLIGAIFSLVLALAYSQLVGTFARSGGEYVYASRIFSPVFGAMVGGAVLIALFLNCANTVVGIGQIAFPFFVTTVGQALGVHSIVTFGSSTLIGKTPYLIEGVVVIGVFAALCLRPIAAVTRWVFWSFLMGFVGFLVIVLLLWFESHSEFIRAFNHESGGHNAYSAIMTAAAKTGFHPGATFSQAVVAIPVGFLFFGGFTFSNYAAGEIKRPLKTYRIAVIAALVVGLISALAAWGALRHTVGLHFLQASAALEANNPTAYSKITSVQQIQGGLAYGLVASGDPVTKILIGLGTLMAFLANGLAYFMLVSRVVFALSFDRLLPSKMAEVREKSHSPIYAVALITVGVLAFTVVGDETTLLSVLHNLLLIATAIFVVGSAAVMVLPFRRKELYDAAPKAFNAKIAGIPVISILGLLSMLLCIFIDVELATHVAYSGGYSTSSVITLVVVALVGPVMYGVSRFALARRGVDLRLVMHELPPE